MRSLDDHTAQPLRKAAAQKLGPQLRRYLQEKLPDYMVPSAFVILEEIPLTQTGKVDRRALPALDQARPEPAETFVAPRTPAEELLAGIWSRVLRVERVGVHDNFFALGGHSILATQIISRVREAFRVELPLRKLFEAPTIAGLAEWLEQARRVEHPSSTAPHTPTDHDGGESLSFAQERLWFLDQLEPGLTAYNLPAAVRMRGALDVAALERSLVAIIGRHEALRTTFVSVEGQPRQVIGAAPDRSLSIVDLGHLPQAERAAQAQRLIIAAAQRPFDLAQGPLLRVALWRLSATEHVALFVIHHIVGDGWSMGVLIQELMALYAAFRAGLASPLPALPAQYADFARWQRRWLQGEHEDRGQETGNRGQGADIGENQTQNSKLKTQNSPLQAQLDYWKPQLAGLPALDLPTDRPRPAIQTFRGATRSLFLARQLTAGIEALSLRQGATLFMVLLAAFKTLLYRYTGQTDIAVGTPIAGRTRRECEGLVGLFANTLVLRTDLSGGISFRQVVERVREMILAAYAHQDLPFEKLVEELQPERDLSRGPLFQVLFSLQNAPMPSFHLSGLSLSPLEIDMQSAQFDLTLSMSEGVQGVSGTLAYNTDLFEAATAARMLRHFQNLLESSVAHPDQPIATLPLLADAERHQLLATWNETALAYPRAACLADLFEAQAARTPDAVALVYAGTGDRGQETTPLGPPAGGGRQGGEGWASATLSPQSSVLSPEQLTYHELKARSNRLAHRLQALGVGPEVLAGICVERSPEMIIGLLGILRAGGAYVPFDPTYPQERLAFMLADSHAAVLITQRQLAARLPAHTAQVVCVDDLDQASLLFSRDTMTKGDSSFIACPEPRRGVHRSSFDAHLAYVIYTSGSTGQPKGVQIAQRAVVNLLEAMRCEIGLTNRDTLLAVTTLSFDIAALELFLPLITGARLVIAAAEVTADGIRLGAALATAGATVMQATPATWRLLLAAGWRGDRNMKIVCGGEALPGELADELLTRAGALWNVYGPTETTIWSTGDKVDSAPRPISIGRPLANTQAYILDTRLQPVPIGVVGELYLGGDGLARGYLGRPDLTAERFLPNPFGEVWGVGCWVTEDSASDTQHPTPHTRLYKTGDLARYRSDGRIEYLGRLDQQVKLRGYRIELGEIEAVLARHPAVREVAALVHDTGGASDSQHLVAYVVPAAAPASAAAAKGMQFSLFYFAADDPGPSEDKYRLYIEGARFADRHDFAAVWTPERHFHEVAGLYPNPATLSAALAMITNRVRLRAGSVVLPLHHALRVAEEWAVVDNLSKGRVGVAFASGWVPNDFAFFPEHFANKREVMFRGIREVQSLWRGEVIPVRDGAGNQTAVRIFPRPVQPELPIWLTCTGHFDMFVKAGELGANVLTALLSQTVEEVAGKIALYRQSLAQHGYDPEAGHVTMMLHTFVGDDALEKAREPFCNYMKSQAGLIETMVRSLNIQVDLNKEKELDDLVAYAFERYSQTAALIGTPETCLRMVERLKEIGVDEIACLIDFGVGLEAALEGLHHLNIVREMSEKAIRPAIDSNSLQGFLKEKLPAYMLPTAFVYLDALPLTPNGKVDRRRLPKPDRLRVDRKAAFIAPRTPIEKDLAAIWAAVLKVERVGAHDNFFDLGGHSLLATQLIARVRTHFAMELVVKDLFTAPTLEGMAEAVEEAILAKASEARIDEILDLIEGIDDEEAQHVLAPQDQSTRR